MIIYIGNILSKRGGSVGFIETMTSKLSTRYEIKSVSAIRNRVVRLVHMISAIILNRRVASVVLIDTFSTNAFWFAYIVGRLCFFLKIPYIPIIRGGDFVNRVSRSKQACDRLLLKSHLNIVPSKYLEQHLVRSGYSVKYIPNFIQLENYPFKERNIIKPNILWVRAFHQIYNPVLAAEVLNELLNEFPSAKLCMVGSDTDGTRKLVEEYIAEKRLLDHISLPGRLLKKEWIKLSSDSDIFINTTTIDNMPVSVIEAMALGMPIVSTNVGGVPFLIEHGTDGILVPSGDAKEMANAIRKLVDNPSMAGAISRQARKKAEEFSWDQVSHMWFSVLDPFVTYPL